MLGQTNKKIQITKLQRTLRKKMTDAERKLWAALRQEQMNGNKFRRQHPFGNYIVDFVCLEKRLVVEVDGSQHMDLSADDDERTQALKLAGFRVIRFWNNEVLNEFESVKEAVFRAL